MEWINNYFKGFTVLKWFIFTALSILIILALEGESERLYWSYWPFNPLKIHSFNIINPEVVRHPGEMITYELIYDKNTNDVPMITRELRNTMRYFFTDERARDKSTGKNLRFTDMIRIPRNAEYGLYRMYWCATYRLGPEGKRIIEVTALTKDAFYVAENPANLSKGAKGDTGPRGKQGEPGAKGKQGAGFWGK